MVNNGNVANFTSGDKHTFAYYIKSIASNTPNAIVAVAIIGELIVMFANVMCRAFFNTSLIFSQEVGQLALMVIAFIGGAIAYDKGELISVEVVKNLLPERWREILGAITDWLTVAISLICVFLAINMASEHLQVKTLILMISQAWVTLPIIIGMLLISFYGLKRIWAYPRRISLATGVISIVLILLVWLTQPILRNSMGDNMVLCLTLIVFALLLLVGISIGFVLAAGSLLYLNVTGKVVLTAIPIAMQSSMMNYVLLSIPFFILTGYIMTKGGLSRRLIDFVMAIVGGVRGSLFHVIVIVMYIVSGLSGSKVADVATVGSIMNKSLREQGYDPSEGAAVLTSAAVMGETVPPSLAMLVTGSITTLSVGTLFIAGLLPAVVMGICIMILVAIRARIVNMPKGERLPIKETGRRTLVALPALLAPVILIGGIVSGIGTPTEVSSTAVVYSILVALFIYRETNLRGLGQAVLETISKTGMFLFIVSTASAFSWMLTVAQVPQEIATFMTSIGGSSWIFMLISVAMLIVMGCLLEGMPAILIFGPMLVPIAPQFGIDPLQYGIVLILALGLGSFLPPIGSCIYVCIAVMETTLDKTMRSLGPYLLCLLVGILLVAFIPWFSLALPHAFHLIK